MDNLSLQRIKEALTKSNNIGVLVGANPSMDQMAAALGLYLSIKKANKKVVVASPTQPIVEVASLVGIDKVQTSLGGEAGDLVVSFPYQDGEIDKVSYTLENNFLNIVVKAGEKGLSFDDQDIKFTRGSGFVDLLFIIGTPKLSDLGDLLDKNKLKDVKIINIDNKEDNQRYGDVLVVSPNASSVSEQVSEILLELGFNFDLDAAQDLLTGMVDATSDFRDPRSSSLAFEMAGIMMQKGATRGRDISASSFMPRKAFTQQPEPQVQQQQFQPQQVPQTQKLEDVEYVPQQRQMQPEGNTFNEQQRMTQTLQNIQQEGQTQEEEEKAPVDWLSPKVYKGSTNV